MTQYRLDSSEVSRSNIVSSDESIILPRLILRSFKWNIPIKRGLDCCIGLKAADLTTLLGNHHEHALRGYDSLTGSRTTGFHRLVCPALEIFWTLSRSTPDPTTSQDMTLLAPIEENGSNGSNFAYESFQQYLVNPSTTRRMEAMVAKIEWTLLSTKWRREKSTPCDTFRRKGEWKQW